MSEDNKNDNKTREGRRAFLKLLGGGTLLASASLIGCHPNKEKQGNTNKDLVPAGGMTYRVSSSTGDKVSILGYGCMRLPTIKNGSARDTEDEIDQEQVNAQVDLALAQGINYFDTSPVYCKGRSEHAMGIALKRHPRNTYYIATKLSNFSSAYWPEKESKEMYYNSLKELQTDYIDYMLLHAIGQSGTAQDGTQLNGMEALQARYFDNGILDFLLKEREAGRIRNLGFSYHGDIKVFDYMLSMHDKYKWDFVQIQLNYVDWHYAKEVNPNNTNAEYLYAELEKRNIPAVIMEPLLGGRLAKLPDYLSTRLKQRDPEASVASWAFRYAGTFPKVLTVLSGMTYMEHLRDNLKTYSPLVPLTEEELSFLHDETARLMIEYPLVPCTGCQYCMPCEFGIDIPSIFTHYNKCVTEGYIVKNTQDENYRKARKTFLVGYDRSVPKLRQADHCIGCGQCTFACPQGIKIPDELHRIGEYVEKLKRESL